MWTNTMTYVLCTGIGSVFGGGWGGYDDVHLAISPCPHNLTSTSSCKSNSYEVLTRVFPAAALWKMIMHLVSDMVHPGKSVRQ